MNKTMKTVLVLGGTGSIGTAVVRSFLGIGWNVAVMSRGFSPKSLSDDERIDVYTGDVAQKGDLDRVARQFGNEGVNLDCLVYSVGLPPDVKISLTDYRAEQWDLTFNTYVKGFLLSFQTMLPHINPGGHMIVLGSAVTRFSSDSLPPIHAGHYAAAKAALSELVKWVRREAKEKGVLVSVVSPGAVDTAPHKLGDLAGVPKRLLPLDIVCDAIKGMVTNGIEGELQIVA